MTIDFKQLMQEERRKARSAAGFKEEEQDASVQHDNNNKNNSAPITAGSRLLPDWNKFATEDSSEPILLELENLQVLSSTNSKPATISYAPQAIDPNLAHRLQAFLEAIPHGESGLEDNWKTMTYGKRKVCMFGETLSVGTLPPPLSDMAQALSPLFGATVPPNHVLVNAYQPGQGILPHTDGPLYAPQTATLSLVSDVILDFTPRLATHEIGTDRHLASDKNNNTKLTKAPCSVLLEANSLLVFADEAYQDYCHGIAPVDDHLQDTTTTTQAHCLNAPENTVVPRGYRLSLTFRHKYTDQTK